MAATRKTFERERDLEFIGNHYLQGWSQHRIAERLNQERDYELTQQTISNDLKEIQRRWQANTVIPLDTHKAKELARIDKLEEHYWQEYLASKEPRKSTSKVDKSQTIARKKANNEMDAPPPQQVSRVASERIEQREGNPAFLQGVERCIKMRVDLLGLNAPVKSDESMTIKWEVIREDDDSRPHPKNQPAEPASSTEDYLQ